jgi:hypothetical protein
MGELLAGLIETALRLLGSLYEFVAGRKDKH